MTRVREKFLSEITLLAKDGYDTVDVNSARLTSGSDPIDGYDLATKNYVDNNAGGLTAPIDPGDDGKIPIADGGDFSYLSGSSNGHVLTWNASSSTWESAAPSGGGGSDGYCYYYGYTTEGLSWGGPTTFTGFATVATSFVDDIEEGITRSGSTFTVSADGIYYVWVYFNGYNASGSCIYATRVRKNGATTILNTVEFGSGAQTLPLRISGPVKLEENDTLTVEYAVQSGSSFDLWAAQTVDGEAGRTGNISIIKVSGNIPAF
jgi:hypothetical protein